MQDSDFRRKTSGRQSEKFAGKNSRVPARALFPLLFPLQETRSRALRPRRKPRQRERSKLRRRVTQETLRRLRHVQQMPAARNQLRGNAVRVAAQQKRRRLSRERRRLRVIDAPPALAREPDDEILLAQHSQQARRRLRAVKLQRLRRAAAQTPETGTRQRGNGFFLVGDDAGKAADRRRARDRRQLLRLRDVFEEKNQSGNYVYRVGVFNRYNDVLSNLNKVKKAGFRTAFIVAFENGRPIQVSKARSLESRIRTVPVFQIAIVPDDGMLPDAVIEAVGSLCGKKDIAKTEKNGKITYIVGPFDDSELVRKVEEAVRAAGVEEVSSSQIGVKEVDLSE